MHLFKIRKVGKIYSSIAWKSNSSKLYHFLWVISIWDASGHFILRCCCIIDYNSSNNIIRIIHQPLSPSVGARSSTFDSRCQLKQISRWPRVESDWQCRSEFPARTITHIQLASLNIPRRDRIFLTFLLAFSHFSFCFIYSQQNLRIYVINFKVLKLRVR